MKTAVKSTKYLKLAELKLGSADVYKIVPMKRKRKKISSYAV